MSIIGGSILGKNLSMFDSGLHWIDKARKFSRSHRINKKVYRGDGNLKQTKRISQFTDIKNQV